MHLLHEASAVRDEEQRAALISPVGAAPALWAFADSGGYQPPWPNELSLSRALRQSERWDSLAIKLPGDAIEVVSATYAAWNAGDWGSSASIPRWSGIWRRSTRLARGEVGTRSSTTGGGSGGLGSREPGGRSRSC